MAFGAVARRVNAGYAVRITEQAHQVVVESSQVVPLGTGALPSSEWVGLVDTLVALRLRSALLAALATLDALACILKVAWTANACLVVGGRHSLAGASLADRCPIGDEDDTSLTVRDRGA